MTRPHLLLLSAGVLASAASLSSLCTVDNVNSSLPSDGTLLGITMLPSYITAEVVSESSGGGPAKRNIKRQAGGGPSTGTSSAAASSSTSSSSSTEYCNVTVRYEHTGQGDTVVLEFAFPAPDDFENRFYVAGGGGYQLSSSATGGLTYGAVGGCTDAGYDAFSYSYDEVALYGNGSINWPNTYMFAYQALGEMTLVGKYMTTQLYNMSDAKLYTYFEGCSDGGREAMSQVQRYGAEYDGVIAGAPAFRYAQQQVNHAFPALVEYLNDYYPPPCEISKIVNATIEACDDLDGRSDGVVSRTDLCKTEFNLTSIIGESYYCAAANSSSAGFGFSRRAENSEAEDTPEQSGYVTAEAVNIVQLIYDGLHNSAGEQAYLSWSIASALADAETTYDSTTDSWGLDIPSTGGEYIARFVELLELDNISDFDGVTYDTMVGWMDTAFHRYYDSLQTTLPDLTPFKEAGGKLLHYHGESDPSIPSGSSVHYWEAVRRVMYKNETWSESIADMQDWYQFYLVSGAAHCGANTLQPDGPYPEDNMETMIDWVENGVQPTALNGTIQAGTYEGDVIDLCMWPTRPYWYDNSTLQPECVSSKESLEALTYSFPAFKVVVY